MITQKLNVEHGHAVEFLIQQQAALQQQINNATAALNRLNAGLAALAVTLQHEYDLPAGRPAFGVEDSMWALTVTPDPDMLADPLLGGDPPMGEEPNDDA